MRVTALTSSVSRSSPCRQSSPPTLHGGHLLHHHRRAEEVHSHAGGRRSNLQHGHRLRCADTIGGFNAMLTRQKEQEGEANVTTILFDHEVQLLHDRFPLHAVAPLTEKDYYVRGCTALLDAIGYGMEKMVNIQRHLKEGERAEKVIFVITTDGLENASKRFSYEKIRRMIEREKERYGWEFLFLGANMDAVQEAARFGIGADRAVRFENDAQGVAVNYHVVSETVCRMRQAACPASIGADWKEEIEADFQKRHQG